MNIFQHVGKPAIIAAYYMQKLHAIIAHETTPLAISDAVEKFIWIRKSCIVLHPSIPFANDTRAIISWAQSQNAPG